MNPIDKRIFYLIDLLIFEKKIDSVRQFCLEIGMLEQTISKIRKGINHFTLLQVQTICSKYNVNANWIIGTEEIIYKNKKNIKLPSEQLVNKNQY